MNSNKVCRICSATAPKNEYIAREMMFGSRLEFPYFLCDRCGCLQISQIPSDLGSFYENAYYSHSTEVGRRGIRGLLARARDQYALSGSGLFGKWLSSWRPNLAIDSLKPLKLGSDSAILDIGCGSGHLLVMLSQLGFRNLTGMDPYIKEQLSYPDGPTIYKQSLDTAEGLWDVIMFHHSLEHIPDQLNALRAVGRALKPEGTCIVRIPVIDCQAWDEYQTDWCQLDAPRHLFLHSRSSLHKLAERCGLRVHRVYYDSTEFQFWGSEQYRRNIPLVDPQSYLVNRRKSMFSRDQILEFRRRARQLNTSERGDQAVFYLRLAHRG